LKFIAGIILGVVLIGVGTYFYFATGMAPVATADPVMPFEKKFAVMALHARIDEQMPKSVPVNADEAAYMAGAQIYRDNCAVCHGTPGQEQSAIAKGMFPKPPHLFKGKGVTDDEPGETYWKVANGIRLTGMPSFNKSLTETQMWQVSLLLANADKISDTVKQQLQPPALPPGGLQPASSIPPHQTKALH
jgi:thiosulfate dehydrogenase